MKILIISCVFFPEPVTSAVTSENLARALVNNGHEVTVITAFPNRPGGQIYEGYQRKLRQSEDDSNGYKIIRVFSVFSRQSTALSRLLENVSFGVTSTIESLRLKPDLVYLNTWPLFAQGMITFVISLRKIPLVINIQDIYPDSLVHLKKTSYNTAFRLLTSLDQWIVSKAERIIVPSDNFADLYQNVRGVSKEKIYIVYNWLNEDEIKPLPRIGTFRNMLGIDSETFVVVYAGNLGMVAGIDLIVKVARELKEYQDILFIIAGSGTCKTQCEDLIQEYDLKNVSIFSPLPKELLCEVQGASDLMILPTKEFSALTSVPSKLVSYMLSSRPILACVSESSDTAKIIQNARCGILITSRNAQEIAKELLTWKERTDELRIMGNNGYNYAIKNFSTRACLPKLVEVVEQVVLGIE